MTYSTAAELEIIGRNGVVNIHETIGNQHIIKCRCLSSFWICTHPSNDGIAEHLQTDGYWESWVTQWVSVNVAPGSVCIDAGSNYGYYTYFLAQHGCRVYSIEANKHLIPLLEYANYLNGSWDRVHVLNKAVWEQSGKYISLHSADIRGNSFSGNDVTALDEVETLALDDLLQVEKKIDFIKLDIAGAEEKSLKGMQYIMKTNPQCICIMEFVPAYYTNNGKDFFESLKAAFKVSYIDFDSSEVALHHYTFFQNDPFNCRMLVIRNKFHADVTTNLLSILKNIE